MIKKIFQLFMFPYGTKQYVLNFLNSSLQLVNNNNDLIYTGELIEHLPNDTFDVSINEYFIAYDISEYKIIKNKIINENNKEKFKNVLINTLVYTGDTMNYAFLHNDLTNYKYIITECTFIQDLSPNINVDQYCKDKTQIHLDNILKIKEQYKNIIFILCHWFTSYNLSIIF